MQERKKINKRIFKQITKISNKRNEQMKRNKRNTFK